MAPTDIDAVDDQIKDVIQELFQIQVATHKYAGPQTQQELVELITQLAGSLSELSNNASALPNLIPPEIVEYVDDGRNPDIYTREFVELVQKSNQYLKGKSEAFADFRDALAEEMVKAWPEMQTDVNNILQDGGGAQTTGTETAVQTNGTT
ncbi:MAG: hypothetical protein Q9186_006862 [Xanthomendoza sp. 1 TL-2023]